MSTVSTLDTEAGFRLASASTPPRDRLPPESLIEIAGGLALTTEPWSVRTGQSPRERCYERTLVTDSYEVWVIHWPEGGSLDLHDHGGSAGAFAVVEGHLDEARVDGAGDVEVTRVGRGQCVGFDTHDVHAVANRSSGAATSVHVYSPPLGPLGFYERGADGRLVAVGP
jgi:hypothetical protein